MRYVILIALFLGCQRPKSPFKDAEILKILKKDIGEWTPPGNQWGFGIYFQDGNKSMYRFIGEGGHEIPISFTVQEGRIHVKVDNSAKKEENQDYFKSLKSEATCHLLSLPDSIESLYRLECDNGLQLYGGAHPAVGVIRKVGSHEILTMWERKAEIIDTAKLRTEPSTQSATIHCKFARNAAEQSFHEGDTLPTGFKQFRVIGRTQIKEKVRQWTNYWYYVFIIIDPHDGEKCDSEHGWVFGQLIKI